MRRIKLTEPGFQNGTGQFFGLEFIDGVSVDPVLHFTANRIGSIMSAHFVNEDGSLDHQCGPAYELVASRDMQAAVVSVENTPVPTPDVPAPVTLYTETELSDIASHEGIAGLRPIGEKFGVRSTSISGLISAILKAQALA